MGYSTNAITKEVESALFGGDVLKMKIHINGQMMANTWHTKGGDTVFAETSRRDQLDDGVCGSVWSMTGHKKGSFKIDGKGKIVRFPQTTKQEREEAEALGLAMFIESYGELQAANEGLVTL